MVDCGDDDVAVGDEVVLIGRQGDEEIRAEEWAATLGTIGYEIVCGIGARGPAPVRHRRRRRPGIASIASDEPLACPLVAPSLAATHAVAGAVARLLPRRRHRRPRRRDGCRQDGVRPGVRPGARRRRADHVADVHAGAQLRHADGSAAPCRHLPARAAPRGRRPRPRRARRVQHGIVLVEWGDVVSAALGDHLEVRLEIFDDDVDRRRRCAPPTQRALHHDHAVGAVRGRQRWEPSPMRPRSPSTSAPAH